MPKVVEIPGIGNVEFPDSMSDAEISAQAQKAITMQKSPIERFTSNAAEQANPVSVVRGLGETLLHPIDAIKSYLSQNQELADKTQESFKNRHFMEGIRHGLNLALNAIPGLGMQSERAGEQIEQGDIAGGAGRAVGAALGQVELSKLPRVAQGTAEVIHGAPATMRAVVDAAKTPGNLSIAGGTAEVAGGAGALMHGEPVAGALLGSRGISRIIKGAAERKAALAVQAEEAAKLASEESSRRAVSNSQFNPRSPAWQQIQEPAPQQEPAQTVTPAELPSGRKPGGIANMQPSSPPVPMAPNGVPQLYEDIAQGMAGKSYSKLGAAAQATIRDLAQRIQNGAGAHPESGTSGNGPMREAPASNTLEEVPSSGKGAAGQPETVEAVPRQTPPQSIKPEPIKGLARASADANALTQKLIEWGSTPDEVLGMNKAGWEKLAADAGVSKFPSEATIRATVYNLKKALAGPKRTPMEALEALKASLAEPEEAAKPTPIKPEAIDIAKALKDEMERSGTIQKVNVRRRIRR